MNRTGKHRREWCSPSTIPGGGKPFLPSVHLGSVGSPTSYPVSRSRLGSEPVGLGSIGRVGTFIYT